MSGWYRSPAFRPAPVILIAVVGVLSQAFLGAQPTGDNREFIRITHPVVALTHLQVIDGTGAPARAEQTIVISGGRISDLGDSRSVIIPPHAETFDFTGYTAFPGLVGMHDHLFYSVNYFSSEGVLAYDMPFSYQRLYLAAGVTTIRTTGAFEPYTDLEIKKAVEQGQLIGPKMNVTGPYLEGRPFPLIQIHKLTGPDDARRMVNYWADEGAESFKVYADVTRAELKAAIDAAHQRGFTVTGHLCSIGFGEAAELGIDGIEHGLFVDTEFVPGKKSDVCPEPGNAAAVDLDVRGEQVQATIRTLIAHHVAVTSTLPVWEEFLPRTDPPPGQVWRVLSPAARSAYLAKTQQIAQASRTPGTPVFDKIERYTKMLHKEMEFELAFARAGGLLLAGPDGVLGADVAGFGDQRELQLLVAAGFSPLEAVKIATLNGARFLRLDRTIGSLEINKQADIVLVKGDPLHDFHDAAKVEIVFKDGVGYDSRKLIESVEGMVGIR